MFQRITKYPLLIDRLAKETIELPDKEAELERLRLAGARSRDLLARVNSDVRNAENQYFLEQVLNKCAPASSPDLHIALDIHSTSNCYCGVTSPDSYCRLDRHSLGGELLELYRQVDMEHSQLLRYVEISWRGGQRRERKEKENPRADHLLLVFERHLVFLEKSPNEDCRLDAALRTMYLRPLPTVESSSGSSSSDSSRPSKDSLDARIGTGRKHKSHLCPIIPLENVAKVVPDALGTRIM